MACSTKFDIDYNDKKTSNKLKNKPKTYMGISRCQWMVPRPIVSPLYMPHNIYHKNKRRKNLGHSTFPTLHNWDANNKLRRPNFPNHKISHNCRNRTSKAKHPVLRIFRCNTQWFEKLASIFDRTAAASKPKTNITEDSHQPPRLQAPPNVKLLKKPSRSSLRVQMMKKQ